MRGCDADRVTKSIELEYLEVVYDVNRKLS